MTADEPVEARVLPVLFPDAPERIAGLVMLAGRQVQQCHDCGTTAPGERAVDILLGGFRFHRCEGATGPRRCRQCARAVEDACERKHE